MALTDRCPVQRPSLRRRLGDDVLDERLQQIGVLVGPHVQLVRDSVAVAVTDDLFEVDVIDVPHMSLGAEADEPG